MPVLKTLCPECDAKLRLTVEGDGPHDVECPKCGHAFQASSDEEDAPAKSDKTKKAARGDESDRGTKEKAKAGKKARAAEDDDDAPRKKKKKRDDEDEATDGGKKKLVIAGVVAGVLAVAGLGGVIYAVTSKDKDKPTAKADDAPKNTPVQPAVGPAPGPIPPVVPGPNPNAGPNNKPPVGPNTAVGPAPGTGGPSKPPVGPTKPKDEVELSTFLPPPPKLTAAGSFVPTDKPVVRPPAIPPLAPDEDPFLRAKDFKPEGALPTLPKLTERNLRPLLSLEPGGHTAFVASVFFAPKGDRIITVGEDKTVRFWDSTTNEVVKTVRFPAGPGREGALMAAAVSRNGKRLAVGGEKLKGVAAGKVPVYIISPETGNAERRIDGASDNVRSLSFSNDGNKLAVGCEDGVVQLFDATSGRLLIGGEAHRGAPILEVRYNPNPKANILATLGADRVVNIWNMAGTLSLRGAFPVKNPITMAWSNDGMYLAVASATGEITLGTVNGEVRKPFPPLSHKGIQGAAISQLRFLPGDNEIAVVGLGGLAAVVDSNTGAARVRFTGHSNTATALDVSPDGRRIVSCGGNQSEALVWDSGDGKALNRMAGNGAGVWAIAWSHDGKSIAWGTSIRPDAAPGEQPLEHTFRLDEFGLGNPPDASKYTQIVKSDEGVGLDFSSKKFLVMTPGRAPAVVSLGGETIYSATLLPKGNAVVVGGRENLYLLNPATLQGLRTYVGHTGYVRCVTPSPDGRYFATGSNDQTIRIWQRDQEEPLLSIFVAGRDWIAWTPQGYYACSGQGERLIAWQVSAAGSKVPLVHPAERFRASMYQPAMLKYLIPAGDLPRAMAMAQKFDKALVQTHSVSDVLPPEVTLDGFGETELKVEKDTLTVKATAKSAKHPITAMRLLVNGRPFQGAAGVKKFDNLQKGVDATATWEVPLAPGTHTIAVLADSPVSKGMSKIGIAVRPGEVPKPNLYVLAMGVSDYPGDMKLSYCATDAELLAKAFKEKSKDVFAKIEVKVLTDKQATRKGILEGMDWLKSKMTPQDVGIVSFSGHGTRDPFGKFYLVPFDIDDNDVDHTCLAGDEFKRRLDNMPGRLVAILDACHSGSVAEKNKPPAQADTLVRDLTAEDSGVIVMCASLGREYATESKLTKAGFYTFGLVEGMSGHADIDGDGLIYIHELDMYATARVRQLSGGMQNPTLGRPATVRPFPIAKVEKKATTP